jgi:hypothetical protein
LFLQSVYYVFSIQRPRKIKRNVGGLVLAETAGAGRWQRIVFCDFECQDFVSSIDIYIILSPFNDPERSKGMLAA